VVNLLGSLSPLLIGTILLPLGVIAAAWSLRMACAICAVRVPDFLPAAAVVVVSVASNLALRMLLNHNNLSLGLGSQLLLVLLATSLIIAISVRTNITSALAVTITQVFLCGLLLVGVNEVGQRIL